MLPAPAAPPAAAERPWPVHAEPPLSAAEPGRPLSRETLSAVTARPGPRYSPWQWVLIGTAAAAVVRGGLLTYFAKAQNDDVVLAAVLPDARGSTFDALAVNALLVARALSAGSAASVVPTRLVHAARDALLALPAEAYGAGSAGPAAPAAPVWPALLALTIGHTNYALARDAYLGLVAGYPALPAVHLICLEGHTLPFATGPLFACRARDLADRVDLAAAPARIPCRGTGACRRPCAAGPPYRARPRPR